MHYLAAMHRNPKHPMPGRAGMLVLAAALAAAAGGCAKWGASALEDNHVAFNSAVATAMDRQMLLNIVRMSQQQPTQWMNVTIINVQTTVGAGSSGALAVPSDGMVSGGAAGNLNFSYTPNITMVPQQGERLARELLSPIPVSTVERLVSAGWPLAVVVVLAVEKFDRVDSFDVTSDRKIQLCNDDFGRILEALYSLSGKRLISLSQVPEPVVWNADPIPREQVTVDHIVRASAAEASFVRRPDGNYDYRTVERVPVLTFYEGVQETPEGRYLDGALNLKVEPGSYRIVASEGDGNGTTLPLRTRSFSATLNLMSPGVDASPEAPDPPADVDTQEEFFAMLDSLPPGADLSRYMTALFRVRCSKERPTEAAISVHDGRHWYWIHQKDRSSRACFCMVRDMYDLQVTAEGQASPVLTLPVGSGR